MLREGEGEKLETIAAEANVPAPRVRQRVSRLRRYYKARCVTRYDAVVADSIDDQVRKTRNHEFPGAGEFPRPAGLGKAGEVADRLMDALAHPTSGSGIVVGDVANLLAK